MTGRSGRLEPGTLQTQYYGYTFYAARHLKQAEILTYEKPRGSTMKLRFVLGAMVSAVMLFAGCSEVERESNVVQPPEWWNVHPRPVYASLEKVGTYQDWFDVYELGDGTYAIYEPNQFEEAICYLVEGTERAVLIDAGTGIGDITEVTGQLTDLPVSVVLTHEHYDHIGQAYRFDRIAAFEDSAGLAVLHAGRDNASLQRYLTDEYLWKPLPEGFDPDTWTIPSLVPTELFHDGDVIDLGGRELEVFYTPGHSPGSVCLLDRANRMLWTGDLFFPGPLYAFGPDVKLDVYVESIDRIAALVGEYDYVLSGHNDPWVPSEVIPRVGDAFRTIFDGGGEYSEGDGLRRYRFDGFDIIVQAAAVAGGH
jgi:glyoxylase-like metal-dependent hydrolase (beta-lactamase superfamily II)